MNSWTTYATGFVLFLAAGLPAVAVAADPGGARVATATPVYTPPLRGAPASRVGGGTRSASAARLSLEVVAPDHTGLTSVGQPTLYWYASEVVAAPLEFPLIAADAEKPLVERRLPAIAGPGIQPIPLASVGATLKPGTEYEWFVSAVSDPNQRSRDVTAGGTIRRAEADAGLRAQLRIAQQRHQEPVREPDSERGVQNRIGTAEGRDREGEDIVRQQRVIERHVDVPGRDDLVDDACHHDVHGEAVPRDDRRRCPLDRDADRLRRLCARQHQAGSQRRTDIGSCKSHVPDPLSAIPDSFLSPSSGRRRGRPDERVSCYLVAHLGRVHFSVQPRASLLLMSLLLS